MPDPRIHRTPNSASLTIDVDGPYLPFDKFRKVLTYFSDILSDIDQETSPNGEPTLEWAITDVRNGSLHLTIEANPRQETIEPERPSQVISLLKQGFQSLQEHPIYPEGFSSRAIKATTQFASILNPNEIAEISFRTNGSTIKLHPQTLANASQLITSYYKYYGSIEGTLVSISVAKRRQLGVRIPSQSKSVQCFFRPEQLEQAKDYLDKRVYVFGVIRQRLHGEKSSIQVQEIKRLTDWDEAIPAQTLLQRIRGEA
ncbi:MAG: hypothetical protein HC924_17415 [Synechococcaceae cyanobacterium SM2_3_2]|nr:hypothetical protein [Synechococcaceae cyanobacterium SM2_3_2]